VAVVISDLRHAIRMLRRNRGFTAVAVITLALGIGANTAIFSAVNTVILRPLPYPRSDEIVQLIAEWRGGGSNDSFTAREYEFYRDHNSAFQVMAGYRGGPDLSVRRHGAIEWVTSLRVTDGFFEALGIAPAVGRGLAREETLPGSAPAAVLTDALWRKAFGADPGVVGRQVELGEGSYTVAGVMPPGFRFVAQPADVFLSLQFGSGLEDTGMNTSVIARLRPDITLPRAQANLDVVFEQFRQQGSAQSGQWGLRAVNYQRWLLGDLRPSLLMLFGAVAFLLLIACANVASLIMARASARERETSIRLALGAGRWQLLRQFLVESLVIALLGGAAGLVAADWALKALATAIPWDLPSASPIVLDVRVLAFTFLAAAATSVVFGAASYWQTSRMDPHSTLKEGSAQTGRSGARHRARRVLVTAEVALSLMLLVGAGLLIDSLYYLREQRLGFDPSNVYTMTTPFEQRARIAPAQRWAFEQQVLARLRAVPGVLSAAVISKLPLTGPNNIPAEHEGHPRHSIGGMEYRAVSPAYFGAMRIPILRGRGFEETETAASTPVVIVSETVARTWWGSRNPVGDRVVVGEYEDRQFPDALEPPREVVGVVADVKNLAVDEEQPTTLYVPASQLFKPMFGSTSWVVRTRGRMEVGRAMREAVTAVNPDQRVIDVRPMAGIVAQSVARPSFNALLMGIFAGLALVLSLVGIYGLLTFHVTRRTQEIGIRMALGAERRSVLLMVVREGALLGGAGILLGLAGALALSRFLAGLLSGVRPTDPAVYAGVSAALFIVALLASYLPARRATKVDPLAALRYE